MEAGPEVERLPNQFAFLCGSPVLQTVAQFSDLLCFTQAEFVGSQQRSNLKRRWVSIG